MLGRETIQPIQLLLGIIPQINTEPDPWVIKVAKSLKEVHQLAREKLQTSQYRQKRDYDLRTVKHAYNIGDLVYKRDSSTKIGHSKKLMSPWKGPYLVVDSKPSLFKIRDKKGDTVIHHDRPQRCNDREIPLWLRRLRHQLFEESVIEELDDTVWDQNNQDTTRPNSNVFVHDDDFITVDDSKTHDESSIGQNIEADTPPNSLTFLNRKPVAVNDMKVTRTGRKITPPSHLQDYMP